MSFITKLKNAIFHGNYAEETPQQTIASLQSQLAVAAPIIVAAPAPAPAYTPPTYFPNRASFDLWVPTQDQKIGLDYAWVKRDGVGGLGFYTQPDGTITTKPPVAPAAPPVEPPPAPVVVAPVAIPPPPVAPLQRLTGDTERDVLFLCATGSGGPMTPAYQRASAELGGNLNLYINAYKGQLGNYDFFKPMEHTGMLLSAWDASRTPPNYVRAIGGMPPEQFESIKAELVALGYAV